MAMNPSVLDGALAAQAAGLAVHFQRGKRAFERNWSSAPPKQADDIRRDYRDGYNIGFRAGAWSRLDGWPVVVLDADIRSDDRSAGSVPCGRSDRWPACHPTKDPVTSPTAEHVLLVLVHCCPESSSVWRT